MHMLPLEPSWERKALNRATFGCREADELYVQQIGWEAWVNEQLNVPDGDDAELATFLAQQTLHIEYEESNEFNTNDDSEGWDAVGEERPLVTLSMSEQELYEILIYAGDRHPWDEVWRVYTEEMNSVYIRATHSRFQLREVMTDFWLNHFSVWYDGDDIMRLSTLIYDRDVIRPRVFENFRDMLGAVAQSTAMQWYLDNAGSPADHPNENYARELMELHTLGEDAYLGTVDPTTVARDESGIAVGFTDQDVIEVSRAFSGWTVEYGQWGGDEVGQLPNTWLFTYSPYQHNTEAGLFLGQNLAPMTADMEQGERVLDLLADHPATAEFVVGKMVRRFFGENPPQEILNRAIATWMENRSAADQIQRVVESILLDGTEVGDEAPSRIRRPFEKMVAAWRAMGATVNASWIWTRVSTQTKDAAFDWPGPDGRPYVNGYWLAGTQVMQAWNGLYNASTWDQGVSGDLLSEMPEDMTDSAIAMTDFWIGRMIGYEVASTVGYNELVDFSFNWAGPMAAFDWMQQTDDPEEQAEREQGVQRNLRGFCSLIATADEFAWV
jgi:uncharacterized protein (DUF1800 family)|tara:strand:+ start:4912 stop:6573 length:1662 start_codon:yes stop_codon:yes gene_type:complete